jgi:hypothetical protein
MGLNCQIAMNLARKMVVQNRNRNCARIPALYLFLLIRLMYPFRALMQDDRRMPQYMPDRIKLCKLKQWRIMMGNDHPNLLASLPRLMLLGRNQRTCSVPSLTGMTLTQHVDFYPRNIKLLRAMFSECFNSGKPFALEFNSCDNRILVLRFTTRNGVSFMSTELYDRFSGIIWETEELEVSLVHDRHFIDLNVQISKYKTGFASFFYVHGVSLQLPVSNRNFNIEKYSLVSVWEGNENSKRIRDCEHSSKVPSDADSKRRKE